MIFPLFCSLRTLDGGLPHQDSRALLSHPSNDQRQQAAFTHTTHTSFLLLLPTHYSIASSTILSKSKRIRDHCNNKPKKKKAPPNHVAHEGTLFSSTVCTVLFWTEMSTVLPSLFLVCGELLVGTRRLFRLTVSHSYLTHDFFVFFVFVVFRLHDC